jgi:hypothetical protein
MSKISESIRAGSAEEASGIFYLWQGIDSCLMLGSVSEIPGLPASLPYDPTLRHFTL